MNRLLPWDFLVLVKLVILQVFIIFHCFLHSRDSTAALTRTYHGLLLKWLIWWYCSRRFNPYFEPHVLVGFPYCFDNLRLPLPKHSFPMGVQDFFWWPMNSTDGDGDGDSNWPVIWYPNGNSNDVALLARCGLNCFGNKWQGVLDFSLKNSDAELTRSPNTSKYSPETPDNLMYNQGWYFA